MTRSPISVVDASHQSRLLVGKPDVETLPSIEESYCLIAKVLPLGNAGPTRDGQERSDGIDDVTFVFRAELRVGWGRWPAGALCTAARL